MSGDGGNVVLTTEEVTSEETAVDGRVRSAVQGKGKLVVEWGHTLHHIDDVPFEADMTDLQARSYNKGISSETSDCTSLTFSQHTLTHTAVTHSKGRTRAHHTWPGKVCAVGGRRDRPQGASSQLYCWALKGAKGQVVNTWWARPRPADGVP